MGSDKPAAGPPKFQVYNSETGELLGRTAGSWAKIGLFYIAYFAFLAGLFTASIQIMKTSINTDKPKLQTRLNIPGLHYFPKINPKESEQTDRLKKNEGVPFYFDETQESYSFYSDLVTSEKAAYDTKASNADANEKVTKFDWGANLGACAVAPFGYDTAEPCVYLRLNRVIDWTPVGLFKPEDGSVFSKDGPKKPMVKDGTYVRCEAKYIGEEGNGKSGEDITFEYFGGDSNGGDGFISKEYFPYSGKAAQPNYQSPMVAVKVKGLKENKSEKYRIKCSAFAKNIVIDTRDNLGYIQFEMQYGGDVSKTE